MDEKRIDKILNDVSADFSFEGMPLTEDNKEKIRECLSGRADFDETVKMLIEKYKDKGNAI